MANDKQYVGVAPLTMVRTDPGGYVHVFAGDPVPVNANADDLKRLLDEGFLGESDAPVEAGEETTDPGTTPGGADLDISATIDSILAWVGDDSDRAVEALEAENEKGADARSTLVEKLESLIDAS